MGRQRGLADQVPQRRRVRLLTRDFDSRVVSDCGRCAFGAPGAFVTGPPTPPAALLRAETRGGGTTQRVLSGRRRAGCPGRTVCRRWGICGGRRMSTVPAVLRCRGRGRGLPRADSGAWVLVEDLRRVQASLRAADERRAADGRVALDAQRRQAALSERPGPEPDERKVSRVPEPRIEEGADGAATRNGGAVEAREPAEPAKVPPPLAPQHPPGFSHEPPRALHRPENPFLPAPQQAPAVRTRRSAWQRFLRWLRGGQ